jgi:hypothetical protein
VLTHVDVHGLDTSACATCSKPGGPSCEPAEQSEVPSLWAGTFEGRDSDRRGALPLPVCTGSDLLHLARSLPEGRFFFNTSMPAGDCIPCSYVQGIAAAAGDRVFADGVLMRSVDHVEFRRRVVSHAQRPEVRHTLTPSTPIRSSCVALYARHLFPSRSYTALPVCLTQLMRCGRRYASELWRCTRWAKGFIFTSHF